MSARVLLGALAALLPLSAHAIEIDSGETSRDMVFTLRFGSFRPAIDEQFDSSLSDDPPPYEHIFGNRREIMVLGALEMIVLEAVGTLSAGVGVGYWSVEGSSVQKYGAGSGNSDYEGTDNTGLDLIPAQLQVSYRFDYFQEYVPLVPIARLGFDAWFWTIRNDDGDVAKFEAGQPAEGTTFGWHAAFGAHLLLDYFALSMADDFDRSAGVNNSYLAVEYQFAQIDDFGDSKSIRLGDETLFIGFGLDI